MMPAKPIPLYLAAPSREIKRVKSAVAKLESCGLFRLLDPWWESAEQWSGRDADQDRAQQTRVAETHEYHIRRARIFWMLWPKSISHGALYELGYASAHRWCVGVQQCQIVVSGEGSSQTVYTAPAQYRDESDALGFMAVLWCARAGRHPGGL